MLHYFFKKVMLRVLRVLICLKTWQNTLLRVMLRVCYVWETYRFHH